MSHVRADNQAAGRLGVRPGSPSLPAREGLYTFEAPAGQALIYVPEGTGEARPMPLAVMFHGAGGTGSGGLVPFQDLAEERGMLLLAPQSQGSTWDVIQGGYGPDVECIERALEHVFARYSIDPDHLAIGGFSDGASYALSLGLSNGDLFSHIVAFSPGFMAPSGVQGQPRVFVSHGTQDATLRIGRTSRTIVPALRSAGYDVRYEEFNGPHTVPRAIAANAATWFLGDQ